MRFFLVASLAFAAASALAKDSLDAYNVVWTTPSHDASGSMPMGNGATGLNVWVEEDGDLLFYVSRTDAWSEASRLLKLGRVRVKLEPNPFRKGAPFRQELVLRDGAIVVDASGMRLRIAFGAGDTVYVSGVSPTPVKATASLETWRTERRQLLGQELASSWTMQGAPIPVWESADQLSTGLDTVHLSHQNESTIVPFTLKHQGLESAANLAVDPIKGREFGLWLFGAGKGTYRAAAGSLVAPTGKAFAFGVTAYSQQGKIRFVLPKRDYQAAQAKTAAWWNEFWQRSFIFVDGDPGFAIPQNRMPIRIGFDSGGGNQFQGSIRGARFRTGPRRFAPSERPDEDEALRSGPNQPIGNGFVCEAWIKPEGSIGRIFDNLTAGGSDGFLFDTYPGYALRAIVGTTTVVAKDVLKPGEWAKVELVADPKTGIAIYKDGVRVAGSELEATPSRVTQKYVLQRFVMACGGRGAFPIKFNGSIFTVEPTFMGQDFNPDWRRWGDCFWWQNTRFPYHAMLASGDLEMMDSLFQPFLRTIPLAKARTRIYHGARGAYFPETMTSFGTYSNNDYGWDRTGHQPKDVLSPWWQYAWNQGPELIALMLDRYEQSPDPKFLRETLLPAAASVLDYFDSRFPKENGRLKLTPTQAVETYWQEVVNDTPTVAGLHDIVRRLIPTASGTWGKARLLAFQKMLPPIPIRNGKIAPAESYKDQRSNVENPELYAIWPFRIYGVGRGNNVIAQKTFRERIERANTGWQYDGQCAALAGLADDAKTSLLAKVANSNPAYRWPVTWGPNYDWLPDQDHGSNLMITLQTMLLQEANGKLIVLPAWPKEWNVKFRLHASRNTVVDVDYRNGKTLVKVTPASRQKDVVVVGH